MKLRWPKFLTVKRTILFALLLFVIIFALVYFFGGYKASALSSDLMEFNPDGFVHIEQYIEDEETKNQQAFDKLLNELTVANYDEKIESVIAACTTVTYLNQLNAKLSDLQKADSQNKSKYQHTLDSNSLITTEEFAKRTMNEFRPCLEKLDANGTGYKLELNYFTSQFKIIRFENGTKENEWYSNPQNTDYTAGVGSTLANQKSPLILYYYTPNGATLPYSAFEYSINDNQGSADAPTYVDQTFSYKLDPTNGTLQVYYELQSKGHKYYDYPKYLTPERVNELIQRNKDFVAAELAAFDTRNMDELQQYFNDHYSVRYIKRPNEIGSKRQGFIGPESYKYFVEKFKYNDSDYKDVNIDNIVSRFKSMVDANKLEAVRNLCKIMFRLEYEYTDSKHEFVKNGNILKTSDASEFLKNQYKLDDTLSDSAHPFPFYEIVDDYDETMGYRSSQFIAQTLKKFQYSEEDLTIDQELFGVEIVSNKPSFKVGVQYTLTDKGFEAKVINNSLSESLPEKYPIYKIEILPYFSAISADYAPYKYEDGKKQIDKINTLESNGYMVIPDGSGGIINLNNGKFAYQKRVYSTDLAFVDEVKKTASEDILLPMFGLTYDSVDFSSVAPGKEGSFRGSSVIARATQGASQMILTAGVSAASDAYNRICFAATYRESQTVTIGTGYYANPVTQVTPTNVKTDFTVEYSLINEQGLTYSDIAKRYQEMLYGDVLEQNAQDKTNTPVLNAEYLGLYDYKTNFLGIVYNGHDSLTTYSQAIDVTKKLQEWGAEKINVMYLGWQDSGFVNETFNDMKFTKDLGNKKELQSMLNYFKENDVTLYPNVSFLEVNKINESFGKIRYASRDISNEFTEKYPYDLASGVFDKKQRAIYTISPKFFDVFSSNLVENFKKNNPELESMAFEKLGSKIVGDYKKKNEFFRFNSVVEQINVFEKLNANNIKNLTLTAPYEFAVKYANNIVELPYESTLLDIFDYSVPFYQLVFSGYRDYSGMNINANDEKGLNYHIMKILETGSNIEFTFSYDDSNELIQTDYNYYYYTYYLDWAKEVSSLLTVLNKLELHKYYLASHECVAGNTSVFKVTYKVKDECKAQVSDPEFSIYLNYSDMNVNLSDTLTYIDIENSDAQYNPFKNQTTGGVLEPWSCATDKEVA